MQVLEDLRCSYLDPEVGPSELGILNIFLGGSTLQQDVPVSENNISSDWDGIAFVASREDAVRLMVCKRRKLRELLRISTEEGNDETWTDGIALSRDACWQIIRFSGWTLQGSKRTLKVWNLEDLNRLSQCKVNRLGILSHKAIATIQIRDASQQTHLALLPADRISTSCLIMYDYDFFSVAGTEPHLRGFYSPGVLFDTLLTSVSLYEQITSSSRSIKSLIFNQWSRLNKDGAASLLCASLHRWPEFTTERQQSTFSLLQGFETEARNSVIYEAEECAFEQATSLTLEARTIGTLHVEGSAAYASYLFFPLALREAEKIATQVEEFSLNSSTANQGSNASHVGEFFEGISEALYTPFSRNSSIGRMSLRRKADNCMLDVFVKNSHAIDSELAGLKLLQPHFSADKLQVAIASDPARLTIYYRYYHSKSLLDIRFDNYLQTPHTFASSLSEPDLVRWLLSIEIFRCQDILNLYRRTLVSAPSREQTLKQDFSAINNYFFDRLHNSARLLDFYGNITPSFLAVDSHTRLSLSSFLRIPICINGRTYDCLENYLRYAETSLDPSTADSMRMPKALGLGDGHGGNVLIAEARSRLTNPALRYIDYEVVGFHSPVLDLAKPIYLDCFCNILWADLLSADLTQRSSTNHVPLVSWRFHENQIHIEYSFTPSQMDRTLAIAKLEYLLRPVLCICRNNTQDEQQRRIDYEHFLGQALLVCAILTRDYPSRADVFYINLAVGLELADDLMGTLHRWFGWRV